MRYGYRWDPQACVVSSRESSRGVWHEVGLAPRCGSLRAEFRKIDEAIAGYSMRDCDTLTSDHLNKDVTWKGNEKLPQMIEGDKFEAVTEIERGTLYAFEFSA